MRFVCDCGKEVEEQPTITDSQLIKGPLKSWGVGWLTMIMGMSMSMRMGSEKSSKRS